MRFHFAILLATAACLSLSSCALLRGGNDTEPVSAMQQTDVAADGDARASEMPEAQVDSADMAPTPEPEPLQLTTLYSTASLNVRAGRGTTYEVVAGLSHGDEVEAGRLRDGWYELFEGGRSIGFAHADYLSPDRPEPKPADGVPSASFETGLFGVSLPVGSSLVDKSALTENADASESYRVPMATEEIRAFFERELASLGWSPAPSETESTLTYRKGNLVLSVVLDSKGQRFTLTGGQR